MALLGERPVNLGEKERDRKKRRTKSIKNFIADSSIPSLFPNAAHLLPVLDWDQEDEWI